MTSEFVVLPRTSQRMPLVGLGLWKISKATCPDTVYNAIKAGYRLFDGACDYGNEKEAGEGIRRAISDGLVKREELFITSKLWNTFHAKEHVKPMAKLQLELWGLDYFDLFLIHFPVALEYVDPAHRFPPEWWGDDKKTVTLANVPYQETWTAMEELVDEGLAKNIGFSNIQSSLILDVLRYAHILPQVLQVEIHPYLNQQPLVKLAKTLGIAVTAYSSFGPQGYYEIGMGTGVISLFENDVVRGIAERVGKSPAQVLLRWSTQRGIAVIPKTEDPEKLVENLACTTFELSEEEIEAINSLNRNIRLNDPALIDPRLAIFA